MRNCNCNQLGFSRIFRAFEFFALIMLIAVSSGRTVAAASKSPAAGLSSFLSTAAKCEADLAKRLKLRTQDIKAIGMELTAWPDAALGMPKIGQTYARAKTPGSLLLLEARGSRYLYTISAKAYRYGGPLSIWSYSMLYLRPTPNEPNLNGDLYQCSLLGTNSVRRLSGVTDYYPQEKGVVIAKRRTSRSSHDLLYVRADQPGEAKTLYQAFDFGDAAFNSAQDQWAGFVRPMVGAAWNITVARIGQDASEARALALPDGVRPGRIAWSGEMLIILVNQGEHMVAFETSPKAGTSEWKAVGAHTFPGLPDFMLSKSQTLEIGQVNDNGKPGVEVASVWFTGDRDVVARIADVTLGGYDLLGPYAFIWGERNSKAVAYTVDISTGEVIPSFPGAVRNIRPFSYPPHDGPMGVKK